MKRSSWAKRWGKSWKKSWGKVYEDTSPLQSPFYTPASGGPGSQITLRQMRLKSRRRREQQAFAIGIL